MLRLFVSFFLAALAAAWAEPVDWICTARWVVTMDAKRQVIQNGAVAIRGGRIVAVGPRAQIDRRYQARQRLDRPESLIAPGLINTHAHAAMSLFRGIADDMRLQDWLEKFIFPAESKNVTPEFARWGTRLAALEMMLSGTTTYTDMYYFEDVVAEATRQAGLRGVLGETIIGFPVPDAKTPADALAFTARFIQKFHKDELIVPAVAPHALDTNTEQTLRAARALANRFSVPLLIHVSETQALRDASIVKYKEDPVQALDGWGIFNGRTVAAHCVWVDESDMKTLAARGVGVAHCPSSNTKLASGVAPVARMLAHGIAAGLGTDGPAGSNNDFDLMEEMDLAAKLQKVTTGDPRALPAEKTLEMATILGAKVLGMEKEIGSLEPGKRADLITLRLDRPNAVPLYNVYSQIVYALKGCDVRDTMVNGRLIVRDRRSLTLDERQVLAKAEEFGLRIRKSLGN